MLHSQSFPVSLVLSAHIQAEQFSRHQANALKAKQVYQNTLAVLAVNNYLNYSGWVTSLKTSDSWNPIMQSLMNVADLDIPQYGKVECCLVEPNAEFLLISPEAKENRIAYIAVKFEPALERARILGFIQEFTSEKVLLSQLKPSIEIVEYLRSLKSQKESKTCITQLKRWLIGKVEPGWLVTDEVFLPTLNFSFRKPQQLRGNMLPQETLNEEICRVKLLDIISDQNTITIALIICIKEQEADLDISVKICPTGNDNYLPKGLEIFILDEQQQSVMHAQANDTKTIEFRFSGASEETFGIKICLAQQTQIETFTI
ncbi:MAG TPA: DUF1822 family protein [Xenococcaceae cyanobacterium]|jgi:hypothetical protein